MSVGEVAGLLAALAAIVFVGLCAVPLLKLGGVLDELRAVVKDLGMSTTPILDELKGTVTTTTDEIARLSQVTEELTRMSQNASAMTKQAADVSTVVATPLVKTAEVVGKGASAVSTVASNVRRRRRPVRLPAAELPAGRVGDRTTTDSAGTPSTSNKPSKPNKPSTSIKNRDDHESR